MSTQSPTPNPYAHPSFFPTHALVRTPCMSTQLTHYLFIWQDHAFAGIGAGTAAVLCMNPLDLLKVKFQVSTRAPGSGVGRGIWLALRDIHASEGWRGLYRGLGPNVAGNASSWGLYFLLCVLHSFPFVFYSYIFCLFGSLIAIINSSVARRSEHPINPSPPHSISSFPLKRVRISSMLFDSPLFLLTLKSSSL
jgi:Mitochondrial carrier protein